MPAELRAVLLEGYRAVSSPDAATRARAVRALLALPERQQDEKVARLLGALGADREAFQIASRIAATQEYPGPSLLWYPSMRRALADPGFPELAKQLGLWEYWTKTRRKPDVCNEKAPPPFCGMI
jgi:hypothetical protein